MIDIKDVSQISKLPFMGTSPDAPQNKYTTPKCNLSSGTQYYMATHFHAWLNVYSLGIMVYVEILPNFFWNFGLGRRWAKKGVRPVATVRPRYKNFYIYSAVCPTTGEDVSLFLPGVNTEMMNTYLERLKAALGDRPCILVLDQAGWHRSKDLQIPKDIELVYLPPYSPELNPVERLWQWLKRHSLRNRLYHSLEEVMDSVQNCMKTTTATFLKNLCQCNYLS